MKEHLLFEHIMGIELFRLNSFEGLSKVSYTDYNALVEAVTHVGTYPFQNIQERLDFINIENSDFSETLLNFLKINDVKVLHCDKSLYKLMKDAGIEPKSSYNIARGIKHNLSRFIKNEIDKNVVICTSHKFSRDAIKFDMSKDDNLVIPVGLECEHLKNEISILSERLNTMIRIIIPQFEKIYKKDDLNDKLKTILENRKDDTKFTYIVEDALEELSEFDINYLNKLNNIILDKKEELKKLKNYLSDKLDDLSPNLKTILGSELCIKLIQKAGGLMNLTLLPSSTVQLLGAEKSLFRSLKMKKKTPKYGILYELDNLKSSNRGRICRFVATKCSLAARIDVFESKKTNEYGKEMKKMIDRKIKSNKKESCEKTSDLLMRIHKKIQENEKK